MIAVTADSNIYVSALHFGGVPRAFLDAARRGLVRLDISPPLLGEVERILGGKFAWSDDMLRRAIEAINRLANLVHPVERLDAVPDDPDDNRVVECAVTAGSSYIVTGDNDLLRLLAYGDIKIVRVAAFMSLLPS